MIAIPVNQERFGKSSEARATPLTPGRGKGRVARARGMSEETLRRKIAAHGSERTFGVLGEPRVNVLMLNLDLDRKR